MGGKGGGERKKKKKPKTPDIQVQDYQIPLMKKRENNNVYFILRDTEVKVQIKGSLEKKKPT